MARDPDDQPTPRDTPPPALDGIETELADDRDRSTGLAGIARAREALRAAALERAQGRP